MKRRHLTSAQRTRIFDEAGGVCCLCDMPIQAERGERWIVEHLKPLWLQGADDASNMRPAHMRCAVDKTAAEATTRAKGTRVRARHIGAHRARKPMPGSKASGWKHRMDGTWERRE